MRTRNLCMLSILILIRLSAPGMASNPYEIERVEGTALIQIDGLLADWDDLGEDAAPPQPIRYINTDSVKIPFTRPLEGKDDLYAHFRCLADRHFLYFAVEVKDEQLIFGESQYGLTYGDDAVEIIFNSPRPVKMFFSADESGQTRGEGLDYAREKRYPYLLELAGVRAELRPSPGGYTAEIAVPLVLLSRVGNWESGDSLLMAVNVYDDDDGGHFESYISWVDYPQDYAAVVFSLTHDLKIDFPEQKRGRWEKNYVLIECIANENWTEAEAALAALGDDPGLEPLLGGVRLMAGKEDEGIRILSRLARESTDDWIAMWAANRLIEYYENKRDYKSEADMFQVLLDRKKKYNHRLVAWKAYAGISIRLARLYRRTKEIDKAIGLYNEILARPEGLDDREIKVARRFKDDLQWRQYISQSTAKEIAPVEPVEPVRPPEGRVFHKPPSIYYAEIAEAPARRIFTDVNFYARQLELSPSGKLIAARGGYRDTTIAVYRQDEYNTYAMFILDTKGKIQNKIENVFKFDWNPREDVICYIEGLYDSNRGPTLWILDPLSGKKEEISNAFLKKIHEDVTWTGIKGNIAFYDVAWADFDASIYAWFGAELENNWGSGIFKYDPATGVVNRTPYHALDFSPDGRYYFDSSQEGEPAHLYHRETNEKIEIEPTGNDPCFYLQEWLISDGKTFAYLLDGYIRRWSLDCETGKLGLLPAPAAAVQKIDSPDSCSVAYCESHSLFFSGQGEGKLEKIFSDETIFILSVKISPKGEFIAIQCKNLELVPADEYTHMFYPKTMILLDSSGEVLKRIEGVRSFAWSPQGDRLAYIEEVQKTRGFINGESIHVLDPATGAQKTIAPPDSAINYTNVNWAAFDGHIYYCATKKGDKHRREHLKIKYDPESGEMTRLVEPEGLPFRDKIIVQRALNFSPDGRYFFQEAPYGTGARQGLRENWQIIEIKFPENADFQNLYFLAWESPGEKTYAYVYNVAGPGLWLWKLDCETGSLSPVTKPEGAMRPLGVVKGRVIWVRSIPDGNYEVFTG